MYRQVHSSSLVHISEVKRISLSVFLSLSLSLYLSFCLFLSVFLSLCIYPCVYFFHYDKLIKMHILDRSAETRVRMVKEMVTVVLQRRSANIHWGFSLAGGSDQVQ